MQHHKSPYPLPRNWRQTFLTFITMLCLATGGTSLTLRAASGSATASTDNGTAALAPTLRKIDTAGSISLNFHYNGEGAKIPGTMIIDKNRYKLDTGNIIIWFDGTTMWTYLKKSGELSISNPTQEELMQSNPFEILSKCSTSYNVKELTGRNDGLKRLSLTPKTADTGIIRATITIGRDAWPKKISVELESGTPMEFEITSVRTGSSLPLSTFRYDKKRFPASETVDLR